MKTQVAERAPRTVRRVAAEKKRKLEAEAEESKQKVKRRRQGAGTIAEEKGLLGELKAPDSREEPKPEQQLMYNTVRGYVSAIMEL